MDTLKDTDHGWQASGCRPYKHDSEQCWAVTQMDYLSLATAAMSDHSP